MNPKPRINPHIENPTYKRWNHPTFSGGKFYLAVWLPSGMRARRIFKRATEAEKYARKLHATACRLYDQHICSPGGPAAEAIPTRENVNLELP